MIAGANSFIISRAAAFCASFEFESSKRSIFFRKAAIDPLRTVKPFSSTKFSASAKISSGFIELVFDPRELWCII